MISSRRMAVSPVREAVRNLAMGCAAALLLAAGCARQTPVTAARPVNVVLIVVDTLRPDYLGCYGAGSGASPAIDALAADGLRFTNAFAQAPITGPSHAALFTSRLPSEAGVVNNTDGRVPESIPMMAELLSRAGYATGAAVAIAPVREKWGFGRGFARFHDQLDNAWILPADEVMPATIAIARELTPPFFLWSHMADPHEPYNAHGLADRMVRVDLDGEILAEVSTTDSRSRAYELPLAAGLNRLTIRGEHPFMVRRLSLRDRGSVKPELEPEHPPQVYGSEYMATIRSWRPKRVKLILQVSDRVNRRDSRLRYAREVAFVDRHVAALLADLRERGVYDDSLIVFCSDHGEGLGDHTHMGHVETLFDAMMRVPLIVKLPRSWDTRPEVRDELVGLVDVLPTVLAAVGTAAPSGLRGRDLLADREADPERVLFMETHRPQARRTLFGLRSLDRLVVFEPARGAWELYDTVRDPGQLHNIFAADDPQSLLWQRKLRERLGVVMGNAPSAHGEVAPVDEETRAMLRSLGYL